MFQGVGTAWATNQRGESTSGSFPEGKVASRVPFPVCLHSAALGAPAVCGASGGRFRGQRKGQTTAWKGTRVYCKL